MRNRRRGIPLIALLILMTGGIPLIVLGGCSGNHASTSAAQEASTLGRAEVAMRWPERTRLVPFASESILVRIVRGDAVLGERLLVRPASGGTVSAVFNRLSTGDATIQAFAYPAADGSGVAQAQGAIPVTIAGGQAVPVRLTLGSTIDRVELAPPQSLTVGQKAALILTARNTAGEVVLISAEKVNWVSSSVAVASVAGGTLSALTTGTTTITATETESGKSTTTAVQVNALPSDPVPSLIYDGFAYTPGTQLAGLNGGNGWTGAWQGNGPGTPSVIVSSSLTYGNLTTTGNAFRAASSSAIGHDRNYGPLPTTPGTTRYWSFLIRPEAVTGGSPDTYFSYAVGNRSFGKGGKQSQLGIERGGGGEFVSAGITPQANTTYFFAIRVAYGETADTYDFFVNPTPGSPLPAQPNARQVLSHDPGPDNGHGFGASVPTTFDELRIGPTWESVSPTSTPGGNEAVVCSPSTGHCYERIYVGNNPAAFEDTRDAAAARSYNGRPGHLATITSKAESDFLKANFDVGWVRIGGYQDKSSPKYAEPGGGWRWVTPEPWDYTEWEVGEPNNSGNENFLVIFPNGTWNDNVSKDHVAYLVEYEP